MGSTTSSHFWCCKNSWGVEIAPRPSPARVFYIVVRIVVLSLGNFVVVMVWDPLGEHPLIIGAVKIVG